MKLRTLAPFILGALLVFMAAVSFGAERKAALQPSTPEEVGDFAQKAPMPQISKYQQHRVVRVADCPENDVDCVQNLDPDPGGGGGYTSPCVHEVRCNFDTKKCESPGTYGCSYTTTSTGIRCKSCQWF